jgi:hypothetical protein
MFGPDETTFAESAELEHYEAEYQAIIHMNSVFLANFYVFCPPISSFTGGILIEAK